jgi:transcription antitermination factor NusG
LSVEPQRWGRTTWEPAAAFAAETHWYAIYTRSRHEKKATGELHQMGMDAFLPTVSAMRRWSDRNKLVDQPLFPGYLFVRTAPSVETRLKMLQASGVVDIVGVKGWGSPIPDEQIDSLRNLLSQGVPFGFHPFLREGQRVRVRGGCLDGLEGILVERLSDRSLVLSIDPIHRSISVQITDYHVEPV